MKSTLRIRSVRAVLILWMAAFSSFATGQDAGDTANKTPTDKWAKHYYDRVAQFEQENAPRRNVVIVGSSHVEGLDAASLPPRWQVINRGISSDRIGIGERGILHRLDSSVFNCDPSVVVLQNGANDLGELWRHGTPSMDEIEACYRKVVQQIRGRLPDVPLIIVGLFPTRDKYADLTPFIVKLDARLKEIAADYDCTFLEVYPSFADLKGLLREEYSRDGLHLTKPGYQLWARMLDDALAHVVALEETAPDPAATARKPESNLDAYNVRAFGAVGDGKSDDTAAFQAALDAAGNAGGGIVNAPRGTYLIAGHLKVPMAVTLSGIWQYAPAHAGIRDAGQPKPHYGTTLLAVAGEGSETGEPFIRLTTNSVLRGVVIYYPKQDPKTVPRPYPYTIEMRGNNPAVIDVEMLNPYNAIDATRNQRALIRNVHGQALRRGIYVDSIYDVGRIENVHWNPWWSMEKDLIEWQRANGEAFIFGRADWHYVLNTFCFGYRIGYHFIETDKGGTNGNFLGIGADDCQEACVMVEQSSPYGILITNGEFVSFHGPNPTMVVVGPTHSGSVRFSNCAFWGPNKQVARIAGTGTVGFSDCTFMQWDKDSEGRAAIQVESGTVLVRGCEFKKDAAQVRLGQAVLRAVISENVFSGPLRIDNQSKGSVQTGLNATLSSEHK